MKLQLNRKATKGYQILGNLKVVDDYGSIVWQCKALEPLKGCATAGIYRCSKVQSSDRYRFPHIKIDSGIVIRNGSHKTEGDILVGSKYKDTGNYTSVLGSRYILKRLMTYTISEFDIYIVDDY